jgi:thiol-disulfide isomerase/thioredoxin
MRFHLSIAIASVLTLGSVCAAVLAQQKTSIARAPVTPTIVNGHPLDGIDITDYGADVREINLDGLKKILARDPNDKRPLLLNFWATWCDPCREEFPDLVKLDADYKDKGLNFIAVSLDDITDIQSEVPKFLSQMKATMPVVLLNVKDPEPAIKVVDATWDGQLPATFLYDKDGKVVFKHFGRIKPVELRAAIDTQLRKQ